MRIESELIGTVKKVLNKYHTKRVLIAVSGGVDSMALLTIVSRLLNKNDFGVINVDHDLRPESAAEVEFLRNYCEQHEFKFYTTKWQDHPKEDISMEAAGRKFRYDFFAKIMKQDNYDTLLTAHHANDLSENILMKMIRSGNIYEVTSLKEKRKFATGQLVRPLLNFSKKDLKKYAAYKGLDYVTDETNLEDITMRNRLRNNIFPELEQENGQLLNHFLLFDQQMNALLQIANNKFSEIERQMNIKQGEEMIYGDIDPVNELDVNQQSLFWGSFFTRNLTNLSVSNKQIKQIIEIIKGDNPNASIDLEDDWQFEREYKKFVLSKHQKHRTLIKNVKVNQSTKIGDQIITVHEVPIEDADIIVDERPKEIILRTRLTGDKLLIGNNKHQKLSKRFINKKIPEYQRNNSIILLFDNQIVWVEKIYKIVDYLKKGKFGYKIDLNEVER